MTCYIQYINRIPSSYHMKHNVCILIKGVVLLLCTLNSFQINFHALLVDCTRFEPFELEWRKDSFLSIYKKVFEPLDTVSVHKLNLNYRYVTYQCYFDSHSHFLVQMSPRPCSIITVLS